MTEPTSSDTAEAAGGEGWAKTVVDGITDGETGPPDSPGGAEAAASNDRPVDDIDEFVADEVVIDGLDVDLLDDSIVEAELIDDPAGSDVAGSGVTETGATASTRPAAADGSPISVEDLVADLERVSTERDRYLDASRRLQAEFENYKKQIIKRESEARDRANDALIGELLPVLDAFDGAIANGAEDVAPMRGTFLDALGKQGLERIEPTDDAFDPNLHEAVMHEPGDEADGPVVAEVMRAGYLWKGRVLRPAMVKTRG